MHFWLKIENERQRREKELKKRETLQKRKASAEKKARAAAARAAAQESEAPAVALVKMAGFVGNTATTVSHQQLKDFLSFLKKELSDKGYQELSDQLPSQRKSKKHMVTFLLDQEGQIRAAMESRRRRRARSQ